jgi:hypothetical protein
MTNEEIHCTMQYTHVAGIVYFVHCSLIHFQEKIKHSSTMRILHLPRSLKIVVLYMNEDVVSLFTFT